MTESSKWTFDWVRLKGRLLLVKWIERKATASASPGERRRLIAEAQREIARATDASIRSVYAWYVGCRRPGEQGGVRVALASFTGIPESAWMTREERAADRARRKRLRAA